MNWLPLVQMKYYPSSDEHHHVSDPACWLVVWLLFPGRGFELLKSELNSSEISPRKVHVSKCVNTFQEKFSTSCVWLFEMQAWDIRLEVRCKAHATFIYQLLEMEFSQLEFLFESYFANFPHRIHVMRVFNWALCVVNSRCAFQKAQKEKKPQLRINQQKQYGVF